MKYKSKKLRKKIDKIKDPYEDPMEKTKKRLRKRLTLLSTGGKVERSHKNVVGNVANKNIEKRYNIAAKALERIENEKKKRLKEEWVTSTKDSSGTIEIFVNPSKKEMDEASLTIDGVKYIRFIATKKKELYVFEPTLLHGTATGILKRKGKDITYGESFNGTAFKKGGDWYYEGSDLDFQVNPFIKFPWLKKYFKNDKKWKNSFSIGVNTAREAKRWQEKTKEKT